MLGSSAAASPNHKEHQTEPHIMQTTTDEVLGRGATLLATAPPRLGLTLVTVSDGLGQTALELLNAQPKVTAHGRQAAGPKQHRQDDDHPTATQKDRHPLAPPLPSRSL